MRPFTYVRATSVADAAREAAKPGARLVAGGTNLIDLMKVGAETPTHIIDIGRLPLAGIEDTKGHGLRIGALATMSQIASDPQVRARYPLLSRALLSGASPQLRNKATAAGNLLQRTRCPYFYDAAQACNKRSPGSGCSAIGGFNRSHAIFGASDHCIAVYPSDMAMALVALNAAVEVENAAGRRRSISLESLHRLPGDTPHIETALQPGDIVTAIEIPTAGGAQHWRKVRDRASYAAALVSLAAAGGRYVLGGVALTPWRCRRFEAARASGQSVDAAIDAELAAARPLPGNEFKLDLVRRLLREAAEVMG